MKLSLGVLLLSLASVGAFAPASPAFVGTRDVAANSASATELNMGLKSFILGTTGPGKDIDEEGVRSLFYLWNDALATLNSKKVAKRYAKTPVLLPTVSDVPRTDFNLIKDYFDAFLLKKPQGEIVEGNIKIGDGWCQDAGIYEFTMGTTGDKVKARYTFVYVFEGGEWKIAHHHSSQMPEGISVAQPITEDEVRSLFGLWNNALASLDSSKVADRYSKEAVLLPTVSDTPRTNKALITDYFDNFLKKKPQGKILESNVLIGTNWCQDTGIYEFTMGADGTSVKGRYSFVYVYEDGQWKISHHHSSVMPEGIASGPTLKDQEVKDLFQLWNNALATGDSTTVAKRYSKNGVLLPTISDVPRTDFDLIKHYFDGFLKKKPSGRIIKANVISGPGWAQDAGVYEFTMGADGSKVMGRYSFNYIFEDGEWKISHHHSSVMPEGILGESPKPVEEEKSESEDKEEAYQ